MKRLSGKKQTLLMFLFFTLSVQSLWASEKPEGSTSGSEGVGEGPLPDGAVAVIKVSMDDQQKMGESFVKGALFSLKSVHHPVSL